MNPLLLIGAGGHARSLIDLIETEGVWQIHGLIGLPEQVGAQVLSYPVLGTDDDLPTLYAHCPAAVLALEAYIRHRVSGLQLSSAFGFICPVVISPMLS